MAKEKQKICSHCEGRISVEADTCLYCGMPLISDSPVRPMQESVLTPPYGKTNVDYMKSEPDPVAKFKPATPESGFPGEARVAVREEAEPKSGLLAVVMVLLGANLLVLGLMQGIFSDEGVLRLEWNGKYWYLFCLLALPLLYQGIRKGKES